MHHIYTLNKFFMLTPSLFYLLLFGHPFVSIYFEINMILILNYNLFFNYTEYLFYCLLRATTHTNWGLAIWACVSVSEIISK